MTETLFDSVTPDDIPANAAKRAGYVDLWPPAELARAQIHISRSAGDLRGNCIDCESGDATPEQVPGWLQARHDAGEDRLIVYCNASTRPAVEAACAHLTFRFFRWIALWDGSPDNNVNADAKQYADPPLSGGHFDVSAVYTAAMLGGPTNGGDTEMPVFYGTFSAQPHQWYPLGWPKGEAGAVGVRAAILANVAQPDDKITVEWHVPATNWTSGPLPIVSGGAKVVHEFGERADVDGVEVMFDRAVALSWDAH